MSEDEKKPTKKPLLPEIFSDKNFNNGLRVSAVVALFIGVTCWGYYSYYEWLAIKLHITLEWDKATIIQIAIAVTAFFTLGFTAWQRILNTKQQEIQIEQLKLGNKQFKNATDNLIETQKNNIAKLLVDGTKLLGNETSEAEKMAGLACLANIINGQSSFAKQAVEIVLSFILSHTSEESTIVDDNKVFIAGERAYRLVFEALTIINEHGRNAQKPYPIHSVVITGFCDLDYTYDWIDNVIYYEANFQYKKFQHNQIFFKNCIFKDCFITERQLIGEGNTFRGCWFEGVEVYYKRSFYKPTSPHQMLMSYKNERFIEVLTTCTFMKENVYNPRTIKSKRLVQFFASKDVAPSAIENNSYYR